ncbi:cob(I)yrinic acid a,c-diamide adenosyltransferase [Candidatus Pacearchaeota archaeon]|nr:cob(I)yrinic acid a,c-diamide adenosyltransferase [Candidatus Pacearchaeota archaeon]
MEKGLTQIYWGDGKGKTTAALGTALRSINHKYKVHLIQFLKKSQTGELDTLSNFYNFSYKQFGSGEFIKGKPTKTDIKKTKEAFQHLKKSLKKDNDIVIADEILYAVQFGLIKESDVTKLIKSKPETVELILTGSHVPFPKIFKTADLITEIKKHKHPYDEGIQARKGIEF